MIIEILTIILSSLFVLASWSFQDSDDFISSNLEMNNKEDVAQINSLASAATTIQSKPKKKTSEIDDLLGTTKKVKPKKETVKIECPECGTVIELQKTGKMQDIVCKACGLEGELEV